MTTDTEKLVEAIALLRRLKSSLMHQRRFGGETLGHWRSACVQAEGDVEEWLLENAPQKTDAASPA